MVNSFKRWGTKAKTTGWGIYFLDYDKSANNEFPDNGTICQLFLLKCPWYYDFKDFFHDHLNITAPYLVNSARPDHEAGYIVPDRDDNEEDSLELEGNEMADLPESQEESDQGKKFNSVIFVLSRLLINYQKKKWDES